MRTVFLMLIIAMFIGCNSNKKRKLIGDSDFQRNLNMEFKDASKSPLTKKGLKDFTGLDFFPIDDRYKVQANLIVSLQEEFFQFPTTTDRIVEYKKYGEVFFSIDGEEMSLTIYKDKYPAKGYEKHLFLPFLDKTNGVSSYEGGRFIDILETDKKGDGTIEIDFNKAYNPYCAYSDRYSCPITPRGNFLDLEIKAGVKAYKK